MAGRVENKVAFITGGARGQGRSHAVRLAEEGADIITMDMLEPIPFVTYSGSTQEDLDETVRQVEALGRRIIARKGDVRDVKRIKEIVDEGVAEFGHLDIVVANAGIMIFHEWDEVTPEMWDYTIATNLTGVWNTVMATAQHLIDNGSGSIILTSSTSGLKGLPWLTPYTAAKHGVVGLMRAFASELAEHNIRVNSLHPTGVATEMTAHIQPLIAGFLERHPQLGGMLVNQLPVVISETIDQSNAVLYLASDEARMVTSSTFRVDAGATSY